MESRYNIRTIVRNIDRHHRERGTGMTVRELAAAMGLPNPNSGAAVGKAHRLQDVLISAGICQSNRCNTASAKHLAAGLMLSKASRAILQDQNKDEYWEVGSRQLKNQILRLVAGLQIPKNQVVDNEYSPLTNVQLQALRSLAEFQNQFKRSPTRRELADRLGCALGNAQTLLAQLQARGHLESDRATLTAIGRAAIK